jgi:hypothetical protein
MKFLTGPNQRLVVSLRELPNQGPALPVSYLFLANPVLPVSYQSYPLPAGSQFNSGKTQKGITRAMPIWVTTIFVLHV